MEELSAFSEDMSSSYGSESEGGSDDINKSDVNIKVENFEGVSDVDRSAKGSSSNKNRRRSEERNSFLDAGDDDRNARSFLNVEEAKSSANPSKTRISAADQARRHKSVLYTVKEKRQGVKWLQ